MHPRLRTPGHRTDDRSAAGVWPTRTFALKRMAGLDRRRFANSELRSRLLVLTCDWTRASFVSCTSPRSYYDGVVHNVADNSSRHWHSAAEWAYVIAGSVRITVMDPDGGSYIDDLGVGDLWYFPAGYPHSLQGLGPNGTEFLLIFDDGNFSEEETFLLTDWLAHTSKAVLAQNFRLAPEDLKDLPDGSDRYIFQASSPGSIKDEKPPGFKPSKQRFSHHMLAQEPLNATGGQVRITDSRNFPISTTISAAHLSLEPGALRELHWHSLADEWAFFLSGRARVTVFGSQGTARTFDYTAGDVGIVPRNNGHFIENLSDDEPLEVLEIFRSSEFQDFSLYQWMGTTPQRNIRDHLFPDDEGAGKKFVESVKDAKKDPIRAPAKAQKGSQEDL